MSNNLCIKGINLLSLLMRDRDTPALCGSPLTKSSWNDLLKNALILLEAHFLNILSERVDSFMF